MTASGLPLHQRPFVRIATAAVGFLALGLGWRLTAEPLTPPSATAADVLPSDYVPEDGEAAFPARPDPLPAVLIAPAEPLLGAPLNFLRVTSSFGLRRHPILGFTRMHQGVDFAAREGAPVLSAGDGIVTRAEFDGGYGNLLRIRHADGWETGYAHLSAFAPGVTAGARVTRGEVVGFVGHTGLATGPHLHYEVSLDGVRVDPMKTPFNAAPTGSPGVEATLRLRPEETTDAPLPSV